MAAKAAFTVLVVDDEAHQRSILEEFLKSTGYRVLTAGSGAEALGLVEKDPAIRVVLTDLSMPGMTGLELIRAAQSRRTDLDFLIMTAHGTVETAIQAIRAGAFDFLLKPLELDEVALRLEKLADLRAIQRRATQLEAENRSLRGTFTGAAKSASMKKLLSEVEPVAGTDATILIQGETGTGKEVLARHLHATSCRAGGPFVAINCSAIPENLLESELFGHEKGAFTGADRLVQGCFERAQGGTLFLDEIAEMDLKLQAKILRAIEERKIRRVGGGAEFPVDFRLLAATHQELRAAVDSGRFREDLYFRLNVIQVRIPPLRERAEDLPELVASLVERHARSCGKAQPAIEPGFLRALSGRAFRGNVRELSNVVERALIYAQGGRLTEELLPPDTAARPAVSAASATAPAAPSPTAPGDGMAATGTLAERLASFEKELVARVLESHGGDVDAAAAELGVSRSGLYSKLSKHGIRP